jgi:predicted DNA-binding transcriptional regulator AlpA
MTVPPASNPCEQLLRKSAVAQSIGVGVRTLESMVSARAFPAADIKMGPRLLLWRPSSVQTWIDVQAQRQQKGGVR